MGDPIIFIGMHRSGTSLLGRSLEQLGLFVGKKKDANNESLFFLELNEWLMMQSGACWDQPAPISDFLSDESKAVLVASKNYVRDMMDSPRAIRYMGFHRYLRKRSISQLEDPWGWKDPRNTFTLPFWLKLFPRARVIFIERHGVDVAESLRVRASRSIETKTKRYEQFRPIAWIHPKRSGFCESPRCLSLEGGFRLWEAYQEQAESQLSCLEKSRVFRVRYEELLAEPVSVLRDAAGFCGLSIPDNAVIKATQTINADRAYSYRGDPELARFAVSHQDRLNRWGY